MTEQTQVAPDTSRVRIWNPNAAANWSLVFSPAFGAYLHMQNWHAMGKPEEAARSRLWFHMSLILMVFYVLADFVLPPFTLISVLVKFLPLILLISWYVSSARPQARFVTQNYGGDYLKRPWTRPLLAAIGAVIAFIAAAGVLGGIVGILGGMGK